MVHLRNKVRILKLEIGNRKPEIVFFTVAMLSGRLNVPENWNGGMKFTRQSKKITRTVLREGKDPRGQDYYWLSEQRIDSGMELDAETDYAAIFAGETSVTPLHLDLTHEATRRKLSAQFELA